MSEHIQVLLENAYIDPGINYTVLSGSKPTNESDETPDIYSAPTSFSYTNKQINALVSLYSKQGKAQRNYYKSELLKYLRNPSAPNSAKYAAATLLHLGFLKLVGNHLIKNFVSSRQPNNILIVKELITYFRHEWHLCSHDDLKPISVWISNALAWNGALGSNIRFDYDNETNKKIKTLLAIMYRQINTILARKVIESIYSNYNPEIDEDAKKLKEEFHKYGFPSDLSEALEKIDQKFSLAADDFDFNGCMQALRSFTERFYQSIAIALDATAGKGIDTKDSEKVAKFLKSKGLISEEQARILVDLRHFLSNVGSHRLKSRAEDARLSRGMTIEFSLYLLRRLYSLQSE